MASRWNPLQLKKCFQIPWAFILSVGVSRFTRPVSVSLTQPLHTVKHLQNDTTAGIATAITGSSALINFAQTWQPVVSLVVGLVGIVSGLFAIRYYSKKINGK